MILYILAYLGIPVLVLVYQYNKANYYNRVTQIVRFPNIGLVKKFLWFLNKYKRHIFHLHQELY